jgi:RNA polymerase sigma-70 factor (ECF subfamily)
MLFGRKVDSEAFEAIALPHLNDLYRTTVHMVGDRTEAHDLVQEAYLQAWKAFHRFEPGTNCRAWLFKILINQVRHHRRRWFNSKTLSESEQPFEDNLAFEIGSRTHPGRRCAVGAR